MIVGDRDTIAAIATPAGPGGVGIIRVSGERAAEVVGKLLGRDPADLPDRSMVHGIARDREGMRLDDVLVVVMRAPRSYTGEDVAEVHGHGGPLNMARLLRAILALDVRAAEAGEFTRRAFENGRLDLTRAEAILDVIEAGSERAWRMAQTHLDGVVGKRVEALRQQGTELLAEIEACIDFPEEDVDYLREARVGARAVTLADDIGQLASSFATGRAIREGISVALIGPVNAGKSSIFNELAGSERAVVTAEPGTTRDYVEAHVVWDGVPVTLIDTAGERDATGTQKASEAERRGMELGRKRAANADVRLVIRDASTAFGPVDARAGEVRVLAKTDLPPAQSLNDFVGWVATSAADGSGFSEVEHAVLELVLGRPAESDDGLLVTSERQRDLLERAAAALRRAADAVAGALPTEMIAIDVRAGVELLAEVLGERVGEEVLDAVFARFCIGK